MSEHPEPPRPDDLNPHYLAMVPNPVADYAIREVPRWQAATLAGMVPGFNAVRRASAALISGNWPAADAAFDELEAAGQLRMGFRAAVADLAALALQAAGHDDDTAARYFENLLQAQQHLDAGRL